MRKNEKITALYERLSRDDFGKDDDQQREQFHFQSKGYVEEVRRTAGLLQTLSISRTMALSALALTVPDFWQ